VAELERDDVIYFAPTNVSGIWKVAATGGTATQVTLPDQAKGEISHRWPHVLPGNKALLLSTWTGPGPDERQIVELSLDSGERHALVKGGDTPRYVSPGYLVYGRLDGLFAVPWRPGQRDVNSAVPLTLAESPRLDNEGASAYAVSDTGTLAYLAGGQARLAQRIVWVDRTGKVETLPGPDREYESVAISPDGRQAAVQVYESVVGIWMYDFGRQTLTPFLNTGASSQAAVWTHDGKFIVFRGTRNGFRNLFMKASDGTGAEERLTTKEGAIQTPTSVSPNGEWVIYNEGGLTARGGSGIWKVRLKGDRTPQPILQAGESNGQVSPDGKWLAFTSGDVAVEDLRAAVSGPARGARFRSAAASRPSGRWMGAKLFYNNRQAHGGGYSHVAGVLGRHASRGHQGGIAPVQRQHGVRDCARRPLPADSARPARAASDANRRRDELVQRASLASEVGSSWSGFA
jgi:dipeptidyl aminopeptidase/acylaminoacyl peptidase